MTPIADVLLHTSETTLRAKKCLMHCGSLLPSGRCECGHRPAGRGVISFATLQPARPYWGRMKWQSTSEDGNS